MTTLTEWNKDGAKGLISLGDFEVNTIDGYIDVHNLLQIFNQSEYCNKEKIIKFLNQYMSRNNFKNQVISDYNLLFRKLQNAISEISDNDKINYMVRSFIISEGQNKRYKQIYVHPYVAIGLAMWMSPVFGSRVKDVFMKYSNGDLSIAKQVVDIHDNKNNTKTHVEIAQNPTTNDAILIANSYQLNDDDLQSKYEDLQFELENISKHNEKLLIKYHDSNNKNKELEKENNEITKMLTRMEKKMDDVLFPLKKVAKSKMKSIDKDQIKAKISGVAENSITQQGTLGGVNSTKK